MSNITHFVASFPAAFSRTSKPSNNQRQAAPLTAELRAGLDELKKELQAFLKNEERQ